jgi:hypothetical protein
MTAAPERGARGHAAAARPRLLIPAAVAAAGACCGSARTRINFLPAPAATSPPPRPRTPQAGREAAPPGQDLAPGRQQAGVQHRRGALLRRHDRHHRIRTGAARLAMLLVGAAARAGAPGGAAHRALPPWARRCPWWPAVRCCLPRARARSCARGPRADAAPLALPCRVLAAGTLSFSW